VDDIVPAQAADPIPPGQAADRVCPWGPDDDVRAVRARDRAAPDSELGREEVVCRARVVRLLAVVMPRCDGHLAGRVRSPDPDGERCSLARRERGEDAADLVGLAPARLLAELAEAAGPARLRERGDGGAAVELHEQV